MEGGTLNANTYGVWATNNDYFYAAPYNTTAALDGVTITNSTNAGIWLDSTSHDSSGTAYNTTNTVSLAIGGGTAVTGGAVGLKVSGGLAAITGNTLNNTSFSGQSGNYITLTNAAEDNNEINGTGVTYDGVLGNSATLAQGFAIEDKIFDQNDDATLGFVRVKAANIFVTPAATPTATDNDYTRIKNALESASSGDTINLQGTFDWRETNAAASWEALGNDGIAGNDDDYSLSIRPGLNNVTVTAASLGAATIQGPGDLPNANLEGVFAFNGGPSATDDNQGWTISNLTILDFDLSIGMFNSGAGTDAFNNTTITNNRIRIATDLNDVVAPADVNQNIGINYSFGTNQTISNNLIEIPGTGVSDPSADLTSNRAAFSSSVGIQSNTSGGSVYNGLLITGNTIRVLNAENPTNPEPHHRHLGERAGNSSNITVSNNQFLNNSPGNNPTTNLEQAFWITSHSVHTAPPRP